MKLLNILDQKLWESYSNTEQAPCDALIITAP